MECEHCYSEFRPKRSRQRFCSPGCKLGYWNNQRKRVPRLRICTWCGKEYSLLYKFKYCSDLCRAAALNEVNKERLKAQRRARGLRTRHAAPKQAQEDRFCVKCGVLLPSRRKKYCQDCDPSIRHHNLCEICNSELPKGHRSLCSEECRKQKRNNNRKSFPSSNDLSSKIRERIGVRIKKIMKGERSGINYRGLVKFKEKDFKVAIAKQFKSGMTWDNYGFVWHIDHKIPVRAFNLSCPEDIKRCWDLKNLQPLLVVDNLKKGGNMDRPFQPCLI